MGMDKRTAYRVFGEQVLSAKQGNAFQLFFVELATALWEADFEPRRPQGSLGDKKCDGFHVSEQIVFQCYAPRTVRARNLRKKITSDFEGAQTHFQETMKKWVLVHNDQEGLATEADEEIKRLRRDHPTVAIEQWGVQLLVEKMMTLSDEKLAVLVPVVNAINTEVTAYAKNQLPDQQVFVGRRQLLNRIIELCRTEPVAPRISLEGMGGIGKTATAVAATIELVQEGHFADGQFFIDLNGFSDSEAVKPIDALAFLLAPLLRDNERLPESVEHRAALWRERTLGKQLIVVLDNAKSASQVAPLITGPDGPTIVITTRARSEFPNFVEFSVDEMSPGDALSLVRCFSTDVADDDARDLVDIVGYHPLAIEVAMGRLRARGEQPRELINIIAAEPLEALNIGARAERVVEVVLERSLSELSPSEALRWASLSILPGSFRAWCTDAIWQMSSQNDLELFRNLNLLKRSDDRYSLHDLLRALGKSKLKTSERIGFWRHLAKATTDQLTKLNSEYQQGGERVSPALAELDREIPVIRKSVLWASDHAEVAEEAYYAITSIPNQMHILHLRLTTDESIAWLKAGLSAAESVEDRQATMHLAGNLGIMFRRDQLFDRSEQMLIQSLDAATQAGDCLQEAKQLGNLGLLYRDVGKLELAASQLKESVRIFTKLGDRAGIARNLGNLGSVHSLSGALNEAEQCLREAIDIGNRVGDVAGVAIDRNELGLVYRKLKNHRGAKTTLYRAIAAFDKIKDRSNAARALKNLGHVLMDVDEHQSALLQFEKALEHAKSQNLTDLADFETAYLELLSYLGDSKD